MWPSPSSPGYGSFVKNVVNELEANLIFCKYQAIIVGRSRSKLEKIIKYIKFYFDIVKFYFREFDFVYIHFPNQALPILVPLYCLRKKNVIINLHGEDLLYKTSGLSGFLGRLNDWFMRKVNAIVVPSEYYKELAIKRTNCDPNKIIVSPSGGINSNAFYYSESSHTNQGILHLGYVGRIDTNKGWRQFVEALLLMPKGYRYKATIIGDGAEAHDLLSFLHANSSLNIEYLSHIQQNDLRRYYSEFDLLIFPTMRAEESLGLVGIEAMACGTPVIGSNIGGVPSYLKNGYNGYLVEPGSLQCIVEKILNYYQLDESEKYEMIQNCVNTGKKYYSSNVGYSLAAEIRKIIHCGI
jgi:glycosyltransferase involved in cell wall biosynthesis